MNYNRAQKQEQKSGSRSWCRCCCRVCGADGGDKDVGGGDVAVAGGCGGGGADGHVGIELRSRAEKQNLGARFKSTTFYENTIA